MNINKATMGYELKELLIRLFQLPEVNKVKIREIEIYSADEADKISQAVEVCYHDVVSDIDIGINVRLHPEDIGDGHGYHSNPGRIGLTRDDYLGLAFGGEGAFQMYRIIMKNGTRFDVGFYIEEDITAPGYHIPQKIKEEKKDENKFWPNYDLRKADNFWFVEIMALAKLLRGDYLIADHLANMQINETLVAQMLIRDNQYKTNIHRSGYKEALDYITEISKELQYAEKDDTYNKIAEKIYSAAISYDRLIKQLNPDYVDRREIFFEIWKEYEANIG